MTASRADFKRILVELHHHAADPSISLAAELASLLRLDLLGLFVQEESLANLAALPFAREFRPLSGWRRIEAEQLSQDFDLAARSARRLFAQAVRGLDTACGFEVVQGSIATMLASISREGDIVIIAEPASPGDHATRKVVFLLDAAFQSASAVMLVPRKIARRTGAVVALAADPHDPSIAAASAIASPAREKLVILQAFPPTHQAAAAEAPENSAIHVKSMPDLTQRLADVSGIAATFGQLHERLVVMTRGAFADEVASTIAFMLRDPVLVVSGGAYSPP